MRRRIVAFLFLVGAGALATTPLQFQIYHQQDMADVYLAGVRSGLEAVQDLFIMERPGDAILSAVKQILLLDDREFAAIASKRSEPSMAGRFYGHANAIIAAQYE
jgi:hypothetical protein